MGENDPSEKEPWLILNQLQVKQMLKPAWTHKKMKKKDKDSHEILDENNGKERELK